MVHEDDFVRNRPDPVPADGYCPRAMRRDVARTCPHGNFVCPDGIGLGKQRLHCGEQRLSIDRRNDPAVG